MKVVKNINNNVSICSDNKGQEIVVFGKGVGFTKPPYELELSKIERTFYNLDPFYMKMIETLDEKILDIAVQTIDLAKHSLDYIYSSNIVFTLADHIQFAIQRNKNKMDVLFPNFNDFRHLYPMEYQIGKFAVDLIKNVCNVDLDNTEIDGIALHLVNAAGNNSEGTVQTNQKELIDEVTTIIEEYYELVINRNAINYSRFASHVHYLLIRSKKNEGFSSENIEMYQMIKAQYPKAYGCALKVVHHLSKKTNYEFKEEEIFYILLHINRLCTREGCYH